MGDLFSVGEQLEAAYKELQKGQYEAALLRFRLAAKTANNRSKDLGQALFGCGLALLSLSRPNDAKNAFRSAFKCDAENHEAGLRYADMLLAENCIAEAAAAYRKVLKFAGPEAVYGLGVCFLRTGQIDEAKKAFEDALKESPDYCEALGARALLSFFQKNQEFLSEAEKRRPIICVPVSAYLRYWLGGQVYLLNFAEAISTLPRHTQPRLLIAILFDDWKLIDSLKEIIKRLSTCSAVMGIFDQDRSVVFFSSALERYSIMRKNIFKDDDWVGTIFSKVSNSFPVLYPLSGLGNLGHPIYWIPDFQHEFFPENFSTDEIRHRNNHFMALALQSCPIVLSSDDALSHFKRFHPGTTTDRVYTWHFCTAPEPEGLEAQPAYASLKLPERFYYVANQFWPHKGYDTLFRALRHLLNEGHDFTIVCSGSDLLGSKDPYCMSMVALIRSLQLGENLRLTGVVPRALQLDIMRHACAVIQPSLFEGWSTVVEDARMLGRPLIASDIPVLREQIGDRCTFFKANDAISLATSLKALDSTLKAGRNLASEEVAKRELVARQKQSAEQFLRILQAEAKYTRSPSPVVKTPSFLGRHKLWQWVKELF